MIHLWETRRIILTPLSCIFQTIPERDWKTHPLQWKFIIDFMEEHPSLIRPKFQHSGGDASASNELWQQLVTNLNAMGFGIRATEKWKAVCCILHFYHYTGCPS